uniref:Uncharacterized protein n=1 Tax=Streptomyces sp. NBC_00008 TaxID=2903610 RepID=A0AAU2VVP0_9ACTN
MPTDLQADAQFAFNQYRNGAVTDPYVVLDSHRLFAVELLCDGRVTSDEVRESIHSLIDVLNIVTAYQSVNLVPSQEV